MIFAFTRGKQLDIAGFRQPLGELVLRFEGSRRPLEVKNGFTRSSPSVAIKLQALSATPAVTIESTNDRRRLDQGRHATSASIGLGPTASPFHQSCRPASTHCGQSHPMEVSPRGRVWISQRIRRLDLDCHRPRAGRMFGNLYRLSAIEAGQLGRVAPLPGWQPFLPYSQLLVGAVLRLDGSEKANTVAEFGLILTSPILLFLATASSFPTSRPTTIGTCARLRSTAQDYCAYLRALPGQHLHDGLVIGTMA